MQIDDRIRAERVAAARRWLELAAQRNTSLAAMNSGVSPDTPSRKAKVAQRMLDLAPTLITETLEAKALHLTDWLSNQGMERVIDIPDFEQAMFLEVGLAVGRAVCMVEVSSPLGGSFKGTAFLVAPGIILTNHHVIQDRVDAGRATLIFDYQNDGYGKPMPQTLFSLDAEGLFVTDKLLDCTLIAVGPRISGSFSIEEFGWLPLVGAEGKVEVKDPINVIQHPEGRSKEWVVRGNRLILLPQLLRYRDPGAFAHYEADTLRGSSGSPALSRLWEVFALHHSAVPAIDANGNILDLDGKPYAGSDDSRIRWLGNEGIRVSALVRFFEGERAGLRDRAIRLMDSVLKAERPDYIALAKRARDQHGSHVQVPETNTAGTAMANRIEFKLPLKITIELEAPFLPVVSTSLAQTASPPVSSGSGAASSASPRPAPSPSEPDSLTGTLRKQRDEALQALERARTRPYFDEASDATAKQAYYSAIDFSGLDGEERFGALSDLLQTTHTGTPRYKPAVQLYPWVDVHKEGSRLVIKSIYSGAVFDARKFIEEAFRIEARRESMRASLVATEGFSSLSAEALDDMLEAQQPYNCEHVVPQSWFAKKEPMRGDMHHLFACESDCNSFRGNHAYFDFDDEEAFREFCGLRENNQFEPVAGKGAVARATLYYLLRYPQSIDLARSQMDSDRVTTLLRWHEGDPVSLHEQHRNQAIFEVQGNRNPFIDFPQWAAQIDFSAAL